MVSFEPSIRPMVRTMALGLSLKYTLAPPLSVLSTVADDFLFMSKMKRLEPPSEQKMVTSTVDASLMRIVALCVAGERHQR